MGLFSRIADVDEVAPALEDAPATPSLQEDYQLKDAVWNRNCLQVKKLKDKFETEKLRCSSVDYSKMVDEIAFLENQTAISHGAMLEALTALEHVQCINSQKWDAEQKRQQLEVLRESISACDTEIAELNAIEQSILFRRVGVVGKRQTLWNEFALIQEEIRRSENAHS
jgi:hypothetical protein